ncbi:GPI mannosyltransferase 2, partial [Phakopsora pachyrhizi]
MMDEGVKVLKRKSLLRLMKIGLMFRLITLIILVIIPRIGLIRCFDCSSGHTAEKDWAFGNGIVMILYLSEKLVRVIKGGLLQSYYQSIILVASILSIIASVGSSLLMFQLSFEITGSIEFSNLSALLHIFSPSPSTQAVVYTEPFFSFFYLLGSYLYIKLKNDQQSHSGQPVFRPVNNQNILASGKIDNWISSGTIGFFSKRLIVSISFLCATSFRSIGILQSLYWVWDFFERFLTNLEQMNIKDETFKHKDLLRFITLVMINLIENLTLTLVTISPFIYDQLRAYKIFCSRGEKITEVGLIEDREWCTRLIPMIYTFVQEKYWDVGLFKYWNVKQVPLFILSSPMYLISIIGTLNYFYINRINHCKRFLNLIKLIIKTLSKKENKKRKKKPQSEDSPQSSVKSFNNLLIESQSKNSTRNTHQSSDQTIINQRSKSSEKMILFENQKFDLFVVMNLILTIMMLVNSHVQIILRQASTMPFIWWALANQLQINNQKGKRFNHNNELYYNHKKRLNEVGKGVFGRLIEALNSCFVFGHYFDYLVIWIPISIILWAGFYP